MLYTDANNAVHEDHYAGFVTETANSYADECFSQASAHMQSTDQCLVEEDLDDIAAFPIFSKRSSRRLRRTSIEIYRKSLHDVENDTTEEECDTNPVTDNTETDIATDDVDMHSASDDVFSNEHAPPTTESDHFSMLPTIHIQRVDVQSDVNTVTLPSIMNSNTDIQPKTGILFLM